MMEVFRLVTKQPDLSKVPLRAHQLHGEGADNPSGIRWFVVLSHNALRVRDSIPITTRYSVSITRPII